jgi:hypothetical protein
MKAIRLLLVSFFVLCVSTTNVVASEESIQAKINRAMKAAPNSISDGAEIRDVTPGWPVIRPGADDNDWTCFPGVPLNDGDKHPMCNDEVWMDWLWAVKDLLAGNGWNFVTETVGYSYMLRGDALVNNDNPLPGPGAEGLWDQEGPHIMMLFPTTDEIADLPRDPNAGGPYVMWGETPLIHVMVPITDRDR